ncbi:unnamed protein product [[Candida] boidinii]|uniref:Endoplasmic reticulum lectin n=1 Tax=Candida boidinii TaxID=5477 RepID=A0A9W6SXN4_CANBO|nr:hypothetical protein B5S30_g767 [[Candida] boidinii]GME68724.1 unnamed protein product [[Candida] boidinii]GMG00356.1 unnamed protein product [[Candida] boidinii]
MKVSFSIVLLSSIFPNIVLSAPPTSPNPSPKVILDENIPKYKIAYDLSRKIPKEEVDKLLIYGKNKPDIFRIENEDYLCTFQTPPKLDEESEEPEEIESDTSNESENDGSNHKKKKRTPKEELEEAIGLVKSVNGNINYFPCVSNIFGYWAYEFCFGNLIGQYHHREDVFIEKKILDRDKSVPYHFLGKMTKDSFNDYSNFELIRSYDGSAYLSQIVGNGSICDLTNRERLSIIRYTCNENSKVPRLENALELQTCQYQVTISIPELCKSDIFVSQTANCLANIICCPIEDETSTNDGTITHEKEVKDNLYEDKEQLLNNKQHVLIDQGSKEGSEIKNKKGENENEETKPDTEFTEHIEKEEEEEKVDETNSNEFKDEYSLYGPDKIYKKLSLTSYKIKPLGHGIYLASLKENPNKLPSLLLTNKLKGTKYLDRVGSLNFDAYPDLSHDILVDLAGSIIDGVTANKLLISGGKAITKDDTFVFHSMLYGSNGYPICAARIDYLGDARSVSYFAESLIVDNFVNYNGMSIEYNATKALDVIDELFIKNY